MTARAYYNEFDPFAAAWLRKLISGGHIAPGDVDERSIVEVKADDLKGYVQHHFFAGIGGWSLALRMAGWADDRPVWTGSAPCQPFSPAGKQKGKADIRHLLPVWLQLIREFRPATIFGEQVAGAVAHGWLDDVYEGLEPEGYAVGAALLPACAVGAPHKRERLWFVAHASGTGSFPGAYGGIHSGEAGIRSRHVESERCGSMANPEGAIVRHLAPTGNEFSDGKLEKPMADPQCNGRRSILAKRGTQGGNVDGFAGEGNRRDVGDTIGSGLEGFPGHGPNRWGGANEERSIASSGHWDGCEWIKCADGKARPVEPSIPLLAHGVRNRVGKLRGYGNAIVPQVAAEFIKATGLI